MVSLTYNTSRQASVDEAPLLWQPRAMSVRQLSASLSSADTRVNDAEVVPSLEISSRQTCRVVWPHVFNRFVALLSIALGLGLPNAHALTYVRNYGAPGTSTISAPTGSHATEVRGLNGGVATSFSVRWSVALPGGAFSLVKSESLGLLSSSSSMDFNWNGSRFLFYGDSSNFTINHYAAVVRAEVRRNGSFDEYHYYNVAGQSDPFTVTLDPWGGSGGTPTVSAMLGHPMPAATAPLQTGYAFHGYHDQVSGGTNYYLPNMASARNWDKAYNARLYARWVPNTYSVTLDRRGGTTGSTNVTATYDAPMPVATGPTRTGYTFTGYFDASNVRYYQADMMSARTWNKAFSTTLYAVWTPNVYTISFSAMGGTGGTASASATFGADMPSATAPARTGYTFQGFFDQSGGAGTRYYNANMTSARAWDKAQGATLYAHWTVNAYTVTLNPQGGTNGTPSVIATYNAAMPSAVAPTRAGFTFEGFYDAPSGNATRYYHANMASARSWTTAANATLYAHWTPHTYTVTLGAQGGTGGTASVSATMERPMPFATAPARTGYTFQGYFDQSGGSGTRYYNADMTSARNWDRSQNTTIYAHWTANTYVVTLNAQGGSSGSLFVTATFASAMPAATPPVRGGFTFRGYYDQTGGGGSQYYDGNMASLRNWDKTQNSTLYAHWTSMADPALSVQPATIDFGWIIAGTSTDRTFQVQNAGGGTLSGNASVSPPFWIVSGGAYSLGEGVSQNVTVRYAPAAPGEHGQTLAFTGGGGASRPLAGGAIAPDEHGRIFEMRQDVEGEVLLRWRSVSGKSYAIHTATNLLGSGNFTLYTDGIPADPPITTFADPINGTKMKFWRVQIMD